MVVVVRVGDSVHDQVGYAQRNCIGQCAGGACCAAAGVRHAYFAL